MKKEVLEMVQYAYKNVPYYMELAQNCTMDLEQIDFKQVPILTKQAAIRNIGQLLAPAYIIKQMRGQLLEYYTSGSTGECMEIFWDRAECIYSLLQLWYLRKKFYNIEPDDRYAYFYTSRGNGKNNKEKEVFERRIGFCKNNLNWGKLLDIYNEIVDFSPKWMLLQPSLAVLLSEIVEEENVKKISSLQYIELSGEMLWPSTRMKIQKAFPNTKIANQYGANEVNSIAYECPYGTLHCMESNVHVEILDSGNNVLPDGREGTICVTSLQNKAMPLIRYKIGDVGIRYKRKCQCGVEGICITLTSGRDNDWIYTKAGVKITPYIFVRAIENINQQLDYPVCQFQIVQKDYEYFAVNLVINENVQEQIKKLFMDNIEQEEIIKSYFQFNFYQEFFPNEENGKLKYFVSEVKEKREV